MVGRDDQCSSSEPSSFIYKRELKVCACHGSARFPASARADRKANTIDTKCGALEVGDLGLLRIAASLEPPTGPMKLP